METLDKPMSASIEKIEANSAKLRQLSTEVENLLDEPISAIPAAQPPRVMLAFLMGLSVGLSLGAAGVAIAWGLS